MMMIYISCNKKCEETILRTISYKEIDFYYRKNQELLLKKNQAYKKKVEVMKP